MNYITTTELRTKTPELINTLLKNGKVTLIHRSKVVGVIQPVKNEGKIFDSEAFLGAIKDLKPAKLIPQSLRKRTYRGHLLKKYGKALP